MVGIWANSRDHLMATSPPRLTCVRQVLHLPYSVQAKRQRKFIFICESVIGQDAASFVLDGPQSPEERRILLVLLALIVPRQLIDLLKILELAGHD